MRVKCLQNRLTPAQKLKIGRVQGELQEFSLDIGQVYIVVALQLAVGSNVLGTGVWLQMVDRFGHLSWVPMALFEVVDSRLSALWRIDASVEGIVRIWPEVLFEAHFHEDLGEGDPSAVAQLAELLRALEAE